MDCFVNMKKKTMKRKDVDDLDEDFSDFSLSTPARKIRRLDMEFPPMMEDEDTEIVDKPSPGARQAGRGPVIEELPTTSASPLPVQANEERAIVLFSPVNGSSLLQNSPTTMSLSVDPNLIAGFRRNFRGANSYIVERDGDDDVEAGDELNVCKAMVPWVPPSQLPSVSGYRTAEAPPVAMEDDEMGEAAFMDIEEEEEDIGPASSINNFSSHFGEAAKGSNSMPSSQWPHCMTPKVPPAPSSPIVWFR